MPPPHNSEFLLFCFYFPPLFSTPFFLPSFHHHFLIWSSGGALGQPMPPLGAPASAWHKVGFSKSMWDVCLDR